MLSKGVALCRGGGGEEGLGAGMFTGTETGALADEAGGDAVGAAGLAFTAGIACKPLSQLSVPLLDLCQLSFLVFLLGHFFHEPCLLLLGLVNGGCHGRQIHFGSLGRLASWALGCTLGRQTRVLLGIRLGLFLRTLMRHAFCPSISGLSWLLPGVASCSLRMLGPL